MKDEDVPAAHDLTARSALFIPHPSALIPPPSALIPSEK